MKRAKLRLNTYEIEYNRQFGICWEYHWMKLYESGLPLEECTKIINQNCDIVTKIVDERYKKERIEKEKQKEQEKYNYVWNVVTKDDMCPF